LELALLIWAVAVTEDRRAGAERIAARTGRSVDHILESPYFLIGTVDAIVDKLVEQRERHGISYISVFPSDTDAFAPVVARLRRRRRAGAESGHGRQVDRASRGIRPR
jgi:hypothetical protein